MPSTAQLLSLLDTARQEVPGVELFDAHTHLGANDPDGFHCTRPELADLLERAGARAVVFPMQEPDGYSAANDMVLAEAEASDSLLVPFCRLNPSDEPLAEAERCLAAGARGIKLHPRAEGFALHHPALQDVFALADERRLPVLCHAGRGIPALGRHSIEACAPLPGHAPDPRPLRDLRPLLDLARGARPSEPVLRHGLVVAQRLPGAVRPGAPGQILFASDAPYGATAMSATWALRHALQIGLSPDQLRSVMGGQVARLLDGEEPADLGPAPGAERLGSDVLLDRVHTFLLTSIGLGFAGIEPTETLALATLACDVGDDAPQADICAWILALIEERADYQPGGPERPSRFAPGLPLLVLAATLARTPDVPVPPRP